MNRSARQVVAVGMSGGIDSTMAAFLLKEQGFRVVGVTMKIWDGLVNCEPTRSGCYGPNEAADIADAKRAADRLGIEHFTIDLCAEYRKTVIGYFQREYLHGRTPNPCIVCNSTIKFGTFLDKALSSGIAFDYFATGHYARITYDETLRRSILRRGLDEAKDQSYFLHRLSQKQLEKILFPLGGYRKEEVKVLAQESGFGDYLEKRESQDFLDWDDYGVLFEARGRAGNICDSRGKIIGTHKGIAFYTVGQRRMLNLKGMREPYYVVSIDAEKNQITAGPRKDLMHQSLCAGHLHWILPCHDYVSVPLQARIRSGAAPSACTFESFGGSKVTVHFVQPQEAITPGQSVVFYSNDIVLGGGIIQESF